MDEFIALVIVTLMGYVVGGLIGLCSSGWYPAAWIGALVAFCFAVIGDAPVDFDFGDD
jgi:uncharacterized membrane protein YccC